MSADTPINSGTVTADLIHSSETTKTAAVARGFSLINKHAIGIIKCHGRSIPVKQRGINRLTNASPVNEDTFCRTYRPKMIRYAVIKSPYEAKVTCVTEAPGSK